MAQSGHVTDSAPAEPGPVFAESPRSLDGGRNPVPTDPDADHRKRLTFA